ncbi:hypothetical protein XA39_14580 [Acinetobacter tandoii]|uniref:hypothetical protein n=1 Tax=Acinetobacter tandoii TaxID=202954 RepID=UPI000C20C40B|nr:hypothetical protein [Acinetobacter tandoii]PJG42105.1 hypothetical protein XA39_14580 [Acinetobacter tandoii]
MNKFANTLVFATLCSSMLLTGCDFFKGKKDSAEAEQAVPAVNEWDCSNEAKLKEIKAVLQQDYLKKLDKALRDSSYYQADKNLTDTITQNIHFEVKSVTTVTEQPDTSKQLECRSELIVKMPKGLQQRAENGYEAESCDDCDRYDTLNDLLESEAYGLNLQKDQLKGSFNYQLIKTDKEGIQLQLPKENTVLDGLVYITEKAVQLAAYEAENRDIAERQDAYGQQHAEQQELAQKSMDIRQKELNDDQSKVVERLNQTWDNFTSEQKAQLQQDQSDWFEKRDVDCKVIAQTSIYNIPEKDRETYQQHHDYWDEQMKEQNQDMQYTKCFNQKTSERIVYLNNVFN